VLSNAGRTADWGTIGNGTDYLNQRYTGAERDTETTLDFLQARYLANQQARFVTPDPAGNFVADSTNPQSWNMYSYVFNNPLALVDPSGTDACDSFDDSGCDDSGLIDVNVGWYGPDPSLPPPPYFPPPATPVPNPTAGAYGNQGGNGFADPAQGAVAATLGGEVLWGGWGGIGLETIGGIACGISGVCEVAGAVAAVGAIGVGAYWTYQRYHLAPTIPLPPSIITMGRIQSNEFTDRARALFQTGKYPTVCAALEAVADSESNDTATRRKLEQAAKFLGCKNVGKQRRGQKQ